MTLLVIYDFNLSQSSNVKTEEMSMYNLIFSIGDAYPIFKNVFKCVNTFFLNKKHLPITNIVQIYCASIKKLNDCILALRSNFAFPFFSICN